MSRIRLLTLLSIIVVVFLLPFDTHAAAGDSLTDAIKIEDGQEYSQAKDKYVYYEFVSSETSGYSVEFKNKDAYGNFNGFSNYFYLNGNEYYSSRGSGTINTEIYLNKGDKLSICIQITDTTSESYDLECSVKNNIEEVIMYVADPLYSADKTGTYTWDKKNRVLYLQDYTARRISISAIDNAPIFDVEVNIKGNNVITDTYDAILFRAEGVNVTFTGDGILNFPYDSFPSYVIDCKNGNCVIDGPTFIIETDDEAISVNPIAYGYDPKMIAADFPEYLENTCSFTMKSGTIDVTLRERNRFNYDTEKRNHMYPYAVIAANGNVDISGGVIKVRFVEDTEGNNPAAMQSVIESDFKDINISNVIIAVDGNDKLNIPIAKAHVGNENIDSSVKTVDFYDFVLLSKDDFSIEYSETLKTGKEIKPLVKNTASLVEGTDYKVEYKNNIEVGVALVSIVGIGKCVGEVTFDFTIKENPNIQPTAVPTATQTPEASPTPDVSAVPSASPTPSGPSVRDQSDISPENPAKISDVEKTILNKKDEKDSIGSTFTLLKSKGTPKSKKSIKLSWAKVPGAEKYMIFGNKCGKKNKYKYITTVKGTSYTAKKLKKGTYYKYTIVAVRGDEAIATSKTIHVATDGGKKGNNTKVKLSKTKLSLAAGKSKKIKATLKSKKKVVVHRKVAWESDNVSVATVKNGKITAVGKGTCYIYAYAQNGVSAKIKITVK